jgi:hypothetical protein
MSGFSFATHYEQTPMKKMVVQSNPKMDLSPKKLFKLEKLPYSISPKVADLEAMSQRVLVSPIRASTARRIDMRSRSKLSSSPKKSSTLRRALVPVNFDPDAPVPVLTETVSQESLTWFNHIDGLFGGMGNKFDKLLAKLAAKTKECEELKNENTEVDDLRKKAANYDILMANNKRLEGMVEALTGQKQKLKEKLTELQKRQPQSQSQQVVPQKLGNSEELKKAQWVNKIQRATYLSKSKQLVDQENELSRLTLTNADMEAARALEEAKLRDTVAKERAEREKLTAIMEKEFESMEREWQTDHESEEQRIATLENCCGKLQAYAQKEHNKYKKEHEHRHKLEMELSAYRSGNSDRAKLVLDLHGELDAELQHSKDVLASFGKTV